MRDDTKGRDTGQVLKPAISTPNFCGAKRLGDEMTRIIQTGLEGDWDLEKLALMARGKRSSPLAQKLKELRQRAGVSRDHVLNQTRWSASKLTRIENGDVTPSITDIWFLMKLYGVTDKSLIGQLEGLSVEGRRRPPRGPRRS